MSVVGSSFRIVFTLLALTTVPTPAARALPSYTTDNIWNADNQLVMTIQPDPGSGVRIATRNTYDGAGNLIQVDSGTTTSSTGTPFTMVETTTFVYDLAGNRIKKTSAAGVTQFSYDADDRLLCTAVRMNIAVYGSLPPDACALSTAGTLGNDRITKIIYDAAGQKIIEKRAFGTALAQDYATYSYSGDGKIATLEDANFNRSSYVYDGFDRPTQLNFPVKTGGPHLASTTDHEIYSYDVSGNRTALTKRDGSVIMYAFDALNRETLKDVPGGTGSDVYTSYDLLGRKLSTHFASPGGFGLDYTYDVAGRLLSEASYGRALSYQYDAVGNRTRITYPDSLYEQYTYDSLNHMLQVQENGAASGVGVLATYSYDNLGRRSFLARGSGVNTGYVYDSASRLTSLAQDPTGTADDITLGFTYSPASQILSRDVTNSAYTWVNHAAESTTYVPNGLNQYATVGGATFAHDANGNLTSDGSRSFGYDIENRLLSVNGPANLTLSYDPIGRLRQTATATLTSQFLYDGDRLVAEYDGAGALLRRYAHGADVDEPLVWYEGSGTSNRKWLLSDNQGSVIAESDSSGAVAQKYTYGPYGEPNSWTGSRFRYTGQIALNDDPNVALYHYKARIYDPKLGRFLQTDPVGYTSDVDLYSYVGNDPLNHGDPSGNCVEDACIVEGTVTVGAGAAYAVTAGLVAMGICVEFCGGIKEGIEQEAGGIWNGITHRDLEERGATIHEARSRGPGPLPEAEGRPHSTSGDYGGRGYTTYGPNDPATGRPTDSKQYRPAPGPPHGGVERPNVKERPPVKAPDGTVRPGPPVVRPATPEEVRSPPPRVCPSTGGTGSGGSNC